MCIIMWVLVSRACLVTENCQNILSVDAVSCKFLRLRRYMNECENGEFVECN